MKTLLTTFLVMILLAKCSGQKHAIALYCSGDILDVGVYVKGSPPCSHCEIKKDSLEHGFSIILTDPTYKLLGFRIGFYHEDSLLQERIITGSRVSKKNVNFLNRLEPGDFISIECINIEQNGKRSLSTSMLILIEN